MPWIPKIRESRKGKIQDCNQFLYPLGWILIPSKRIFYGVKMKLERDSSCSDWFIAVKYAIIVIKDEENIVIVDEKRK